MPSIGRRDLVLALEGLDKDGLPEDEVGGITRLQKYLYFLEHEEGLRPRGTGFDFIPYKAGP